MDVLKEAWKGLRPQQQGSELSYVLKTRDELDQFQELANGNLAHAQQLQKLGCVIGGGSIHPQAGKVEAASPLPNTKRRLQ